MSPKRSSCHIVPVFLTSTLLKVLHGFSVSHTSVGPKASMKVHDKTPGTCSFKRQDARLSDKDLPAHKKQSISRIFGEPFSLDMFGAAWPDLLVAAAFAPNSQTC